MPFPSLWGFSGTPFLIGESSGCLLSHSHGILSVCLCPIFPFFIRTPWSLSHPCPSQGTAVARWSVPSQRRHPAPHTCPTLWHNGQSSSEISENSIPQDHPVTWELTDSLVSPVVWGGLHLPSCPPPTVPFSPAQPLNKSHAAHL